jgi:hypothetical protein
VHSLRFPSVVQFTGLDLVVTRGELPQKLQAAFRDPSSPFHIAPGSHGPCSQEDTTHAQFSSLAAQAYPNARGEALEKFRADGFDMTSCWEQAIAWGDHDSFQYVTCALLELVESQYLIRQTC